MKIYQRSFGKLSYLLLILSMLAAVLFAGCSDKDSSTTVYNNCCGGCGHSGSKRHKLYYQFAREVVAKAVNAGATHVGGFAYDDNYLVDSGFSITQEEISQMEKAENGDYLAELNVSSSVKHIDLYFYYKDGDDKLATNCKYLRVDFATTTKDKDIIIDSDENDAYFTIKTYDDQGRETSNFAPGDKIFTKVFLSCQGQGCFFAPLAISGSMGNDRTFAVSSVISSDTGVANLSSQTDDDYLLFDALAVGTSNLYVRNFDFTCIFTEHKVNVKQAAPVDYTAIYLTPEGYTVSDDGTKILDPNRREVNVANLPDTQVIDAGGSHTFIAIGAKNDGDKTTYTILGDKADAVLKTDSQNINNDGFKVSVAMEATADDKASISASYNKLTSNIINITVKAAADYTELYLAPEGYTVSDDGTKILDPNGREVDVANLPDTQVIAAGGSHTFVVIGAKNDGNTTYALLSDKAEAVLNTDSQNISNSGFKVSVAAEATADDKASISASYKKLTSNVINITVEAAADYTELYLAPEGYTVSDDGTKILDPDGGEVSTADLPQTQVIDAGGDHTFVAIGAKNDGTYTLLGDAAEAVLDTTAQSISNDGFKVSVTLEAAETDEATISAKYGDLTSNVINITVKLPTYFALYVVPGGYNESDDGTKILDPVDDEVAPEDLPTSCNIEFGTSYEFQVIGAKRDEAGNVTYKTVTSDVTVTDELTTETDTITNNRFKVSIADESSESYTAALKAVCGAVKSNPMNIHPVPYRAIYIVPGHWVMSEDGSKIYDPDGSDDPDDWWDFDGYVYEDVKGGINFGFGVYPGLNVPFKLVVVDTDIGTDGEDHGRLRWVNVKVNPGDDGADITLSGAKQHVTLDLAASNIHIDSRETENVEVYVSSSYRGLVSHPDRFIITINKGN